MSGKVFIDTNIFIYLYSEDEQEKQKIALNLLKQGRCITSTQVLNEFCSVCLRKLGMPANEVRLSMEEIAGNCELCYIDMAIIQKALILNEKYGYTYYDCLILSSAIYKNCQYLYSEDMQHNQIIDGILKIINPFVLNSQ